MTTKYIDNSTNMLINDVESIVLSDKNFISAKISIDGPSGNQVVDVDTSALLPTTIFTLFETVKKNYSDLVNDDASYYFMIKFLAQNKNSVGTYTISEGIDDFTGEKLILRSYGEDRDWIPVRKDGLGPLPEDWCIVQVMEVDTEYLWLPKIGEYRRAKNKWCIEGSFEATNGWLEEDYAKYFKVIAWMPLPEKYTPPTFYVSLTHFPSEETEVEKG